MALLLYHAFELRYVALFALHCMCCAVCIALLVCVALRALHCRHFSTALDY
jgi:hypothetical protein